MILKTTPMRIIAKLLPMHFNTVAIIFSTFVLTACTDWLPTAHRLDLEQGNNIKREQIEKIETGMSKNEVRRIMGLPMISDPFHNQRWDYIYRYLPKAGFERKSLLTLEFENDILVKIDDSEFIEP